MSQTVEKGIHDQAPDRLSHVASLVEQAREGSDSAFEQLVNLFREDIFRMAYYRTRSSMDAEDLMQDVFMQAFKNLARLKEVRQFRSWLYSIAVNRIRDFNRKKRIRVLFGASAQYHEVDHSPTDEKSHPEALDRLMTRDFWKKIGSFLDKLPHTEREVFMLRFMDHLSIREISQALGKSQSTIKTHLYRSVNKFKTAHSVRQLLEGGVG
jgi:RNA polymerase sigma-70 factor (ECF subfamily)